MFWKETGMTLEFQIKPSLTILFMSKLYTILASLTDFPNWNGISDVTFFTYFMSLARIKALIFLIGLSSVLWIMFWLWESLHIYCSYSWVRHLCYQEFHSFTLSLSRGLVNYCFCMFSGQRMEEVRARASIQSVLYTFEYKIPTFLRAIRCTRGM